MMAKHEISIEHKCKSCRGTGIYVALAEADGAGIQCRQCKGTGCKTTAFEYEDFEGRVPRTDVERVYQANPGIIIGTNKAYPNAVQYDLEAFGGMPYADWAEGNPFPPGSEMRQFTCPAWWYQTADCKLRPEWGACWIAGSFSKCPNFPAKEHCWARWDKEFGNRKGAEDE